MRAWATTLGLLALLACNGDPDAVSTTPAPQPAAVAGGGDLRQGTGTGGVQEAPEFPTWSIHIQRTMSRGCAECHAAPNCDDATDQTCWLDSYAQVSAPPKVAACGDAPTVGDCLHLRLQQGHKCYPADPDCITAPAYAVLIAWVGAGMPR